MKKLLLLALITSSAAMNAMDIQELQIRMRKQQEEQQLRQEISDRRRARPHEVAIKEDLAEACQLLCCCCLVPASFVILESLSNQAKQQ